MAAKHDVLASNNAATVLHIGNGSERTLTAYKQTALITIVEPNPRIADALRRRVESERVKIIQGAIEDPAGEELFQIFNIPELSSFRTPSGVLSYYPGLRPLQRLGVNRLPLTRVLQEHETDDSGENVLALDSGGGEAYILKEMIKQGALDRFQRIQVYCGENPWYEGATSANDVQIILAGALYSLASRQRDEWGRFCLTFSPDLQGRALQQQAERIFELESILRDRNKKLDALDARFQATISDTTACRLENERLAEELSKAHDEIKTHREARDKAAKQAELLSQSPHEIDRLTHALDQAKSDCHSEKNTRLSAEKRVQGLEERISKQAAEIDRLKLSAHDAEHQADEAAMTRSAYEAELQRLEVQFNLLRHLVAGADGATL